MKNLRQSYTITSSKGQIVIPKPIRIDMKIKEGTVFIIEEPKKKHTLPEESEPENK